MKRIALFMIIMLAVSPGRVDASPLSFSDDRYPFHITFPGGWNQDPDVMTNLAKIDLDEAVILGAATTDDCVLGVSAVDLYQNAIDAGESFAGDMRARENWTYERLSSPELTILAQHGASVYEQRQPGIKVVNPRLYKSARGVKFVCLDIMLDGTEVTARRYVTMNNGYHFVIDYEAASPESYAQHLKAAEASIDMVSVKHSQTLKRLFLEYSLGLAALLIVVCCQGRRYRARRHKKYQELFDMSAEDNITDILLDGELSVELLAASLKDYGTPLEEDDLRGKVKSLVERGLLRISHPPGKSLRDFAQSTGEESKEYRLCLTQSGEASSACLGGQESSEDKQEPPGS